MKLIELRNLINLGALDSKLAELYDENAIILQRERYISAIDKFASLFGEDRDVNIYSVSGRSELAGNHTDHNKWVQLQSQNIRACVEWVVLDYRVSDRRLLSS